MAPMAAAPALPQVTSFDGVADSGVSIPPDTAGAVSSSHVFNPLNNDIAVFDRSGNALQRLTLDDFWNEFHPGVSTFDPRVVFDPFVGRFFFATMADATLPSSSLLVAVSESEDPTADWHTVRIPVDDAQQGAVWLDYPSIGFSSDKITVQVNTFTRGDNRFTGSTVYVFDKQSFIEPPNSPMLAMFVMPDQGGTQVPATTYDPAVTDQYLVSRWTGDSGGRGFLAVFEVTGSVADGTASIHRVGFVPAVRTWDSFTPGDFGPQSGSADRIDCGDDRMLSVVFRDGSLWCSHTIFAPRGGPTRSGAQWWEIGAPAWGRIQNGLVEDPAGSERYAHPTLSVNRKGEVLMGMSRFSSSTFASCVFAYRRAGDPAGTMQAPTVIEPGRSTYFKTFGGHANRWGDYSATQVDPDDESFWTIQQYAGSPANTWATRWALVSL
jgi:hypothetical protein